MVYHNLWKFVGHSYRSSREKVFLVCAVISQDHIIKGSDDHNDRIPSM